MIPLIMLTVFFGCNHEFLPQGRVVNKEYYLEVMRETIRQKRTELGKNQSWILHHGDAWMSTSSHIDVCT